jgi:hypothetical protein
MVRRDMAEIMEKELRKLREYPSYHFHSFVYNNEIVETRRRLKASGLNFRTRPRFVNGVQIGYNIYVEEMR